MDRAVLAAANTAQSTFDQLLDFRPSCGSATRTTDSGFREEQSVVRGDRSVNPDHLDHGLTLPETSVRSVRDPLQYSLVRVGPDSDCMDLNASWVGLLRRQTGFQVGEASAAVRIPAVRQDHDAVAQSVSVYSP